MLTNSSKPVLNAVYAVVQKKSYGFYSYTIILPTLRGAKKAKVELCKSCKTRFVPAKNLLLFDFSNVILWRDSIKNVYIDIKQARALASIEDNYKKSLFQMRDNIENVIQFMKKELGEDDKGQVLLIACMADVYKICLDTHTDEDRKKKLQLLIESINTEEAHCLILPNITKAKPDNDTDKGLTELIEFLSCIGMKFESIPFSFWDDYIDNKDLVGKFATLHKVIQESFALSELVDEPTLKPLYIELIKKNLTFCVNSLRQYSVVEKKCECDYIAMDFGHLFIYFKSKLKFSLFRRYLLGQILFDVNYFGSEEGRKSKRTRII
ncbi:A-kinase anchor protein [Acrasis kona]|uniref:A-kinase anchor protein n=1 Tax=Acrasis kona TaxID=1008807 RepID=A0AAW2YPQ4_9EUKA